MEHPNSPKPQDDRTYRACRDGYAFVLDRPNVEILKAMPDFEGQEEPAVAEAFLRCARRGLGRRALVRRRRARRDRRRDRSAPEEGAPLEGDPDRDHGGHLTGPRAGHPEGAARGIPLRAVPTRPGSLAVRDDKTELALHVIPRSAATRDPFGRRTRTRKGSLAALGMTIA